MADRLGSRAPRPGGPAIGCDQAEIGRRWSSGLGVACLGSAARTTRGGAKAGEALPPVHLQPDGCGNFADRRIRCRRVPRWGSIPADLRRRAPPGWPGVCRLPEVGVSPRKLVRTRTPAAHRRHVCWHSSGGKGRASPGGRWGSFLAWLGGRHSLFLARRECLLPCRPSLPFWSPPRWRRY